MNDIRSITYENTRDLYELVQSAGNLHGVSVFLRWETEGRIFERRYIDFVKRCNAFASYIQKQEHPAERALHVGLFGIGSDPYLTSLLGTMPAA